MRGQVKFLSVNKTTFLKLLSGLVILPILFLGLLYTLVSFEVIDNLPSKRELKRVQNPLASELYANGGELLGKYYVQNRSNLEYVELNDNYVKALIATEDKRFYKHNGVDVVSLFRVLIKSVILGKRNNGGGSTLNQQLAKNLFPRKKYKLFGTIINKFREMVIAQRLDKVYSKDEVLLLYTNTVSFGEQAFGLATAAERFFNKPAHELTLEESATLVGLLKATTYYNPKRNPERSLARRNLVLDQMVKSGAISKELALKTAELPIELDYQPYQRSQELGRYFKEIVQEEFDKWSLENPKSDGSIYDLNTDGLKIFCTLDYHLQLAAENKAKSHMTELQKLFNSSWKGGRKFGSGTKLIDEQILADPKYQKIRKGQGKDKALDEYTKNGKRKLWTWNGYDKRDVTRIDSIKHYLSLLHTGVLAADPQTGAIKVWVGGNDFSRFQYDNITRPRQVGSLFKPFVYLTALEKGVEPCDYYANERRVYSDYKDWSPRNSNDNYGGYVPVKAALANSINTISVQLLFETGLEDVIRTTRELGIERELSEVPSIVLGTSDVSLLEMVKAYSVLASGGLRREFRTIERIEDKAGNVLFELDYDTAPVERAGINYSNINMLNGMLQQVTTQGTAKRLYSQHDIPYYVMGKTGTSQNQSDGWFIGFTDQLVVGAWVGAQDRRVHFRTIGTGAGGRTALPLVGAVLEEAAKQGMQPTRWNTKASFACDDYLTQEQYNILTGVYQPSTPPEVISPRKRSRGQADKKVEDYWELKRLERKRKREARKRQKRLRKQYN